LCEGSGEDGLKRKTVRFGGFGTELKAFEKGNLEEESDCGHKSINNIEKVKY